MTRGRSLRGLRAAVRRLEDSVGAGQRNCPACRIEVRHSLYDPSSSGPAAADLLTYPCRLCGFPVAMDLTGRSEAEREALRLKHSFTMEDEYTKPLAFALRLWEHFRKEVHANSNTRAL